MGQVFAFLVQSRNFLLFVVLEVICFYFIVNTNNYWSAQFFNTSNRYAAQVLAWSTAISEYTRLRTINQDLALENQQLRARLTTLEQAKPAAPTQYRADTVFSQRFVFTVAKVINNTTTLANNYLTIDKGTADGLAPGYGVISPTGIVGKIKYCNEHFSVVTSILHSEFLVSSKLVKANEIGTARWPGIDPTRMELQYIANYVKVARGDSVVTSDQNSVFPPGILVGRVIRVANRTDQPYHAIDLRIGTHFGTLAYVYVVKNRLQESQEQLEKQIETEK